jgi:sodium transport system permease protein
MSAVWSVFVKECRESLRDRRVLFSVLVIGPMIGPLLFTVMLRLTMARELEQAEQPLPVAVAGAELAPNLIAALEQLGMQVVPAHADLEHAVREQQIDLGLRISESYAMDWIAGRPAQVEIVYDSSRRDSGTQLQRLRAMLDGYARGVGSMRLLVRGLAPTLTAPLVIAERDQATAQSRGALLFALLPFFLILSAFIGGMWLAVDSTAGERERQSLEPLLINPVARDRILLGKVLASAAFSLTSFMLGLGAFALATRFLPAAPFGLSFELGAAVVANILPVIVPLVLLIVAIQILTTAFAKSVREAQALLGLLQLLPCIPSVVLSILPIKAQLWMFAVPLLSQQIAVTRLLRGESVGASALALSAASTLLLTAAALWGAKRCYESERLAIGG